jgi:predicted DNA-binding transcriptional regulator AlpA
MYAHVAVAKAVSAGRLIRQPCEWCGNAKAEAHHSDYTKPLHVQWLCRSCHVRLHDGQLGPVLQQVPDGAPEDWINLATVKALTGLSTATIYRLMGRKQFPRSVVVSANTRRWVLGEIEDWKRNRCRVVLPSDLREKPTEAA